MNNHGVFVFFFHFCGGLLNRWMETKFSMMKTFWAPSSTMPGEIFDIFFFSLGCLTQQRLWLSTMSLLEKRFGSSDNYYSVILLICYCLNCILLLYMVNQTASWAKEISSRVHPVTIASMQVKDAIFATLIRNGMFDNAHIRLSLTRGKKVSLPLFFFFFP